MKRNILLFVLFVSNFAFLSGVQRNLSDSLPVDDQVRIGILPNGLTYYIRYNERPENRVVLRLVVKTGSVQELDYEKGLAHFVEHMTFNGTENFEKSELVDFLERSGIKFGPDLNAYTSFANTVYMLQVPADNKGLLDTAFLVLEEWAHRVAMEEEEIDKERGVVIEEWRLGLGARDRMWRKTSRCILKDSRYAERLPIGDVNVIREVSYDTIREFYKKWYRPELMAVMVVGDVDVDKTEEKIQNQFSVIKNPENAPPHKRYTIPNQQEPMVCVVSDKEARYSLVSLYYDKQPIRPLVTLADYKEKILLTTLFTSIFNDRYNEIKEDAEAPFVYFSSYYGDFYQAPVDIFAMNVVVKDTLFKEAMETVFLENERFARFGVTEQELERAKKEVLNAYQRALNEKDKQHSGSFAEEYTRHFMRGEAIPGIENEFEYVSEFLMPQITLEDINRVVPYLLSDSGLVITVQTPENSREKVPHSDSILTQYNQIKKREIEPYFQEDVAESLIQEQMYPHLELENKRVNKAYGYTAYHFSNGLKLIAKQTDFKNDEVLFKAISPGGHSVFDDNLYMASRYAGRYLKRSGVADYNRLTLSRMLTGKDVSMSFRMGEISEEFIGKSSVRDMELMFQLFYLYFTDYREDELAFNNLIRDEIVRYENVRLDPRAAFFDSLQKVANMYDTRRYQYPTVEQLEQINLEDILKILSVKTENIQDYTFFVTGNFNEELLLDNFSTYVGAISPGKTKENWENRLPGFPEGITEFSMREGEAPQSQVVIMTKDTLSFSSDRSLKMDMMNEILSIQLREKIREDMGGTYGVHVSLNINKYPVENYVLFITFGCDPVRKDSLISAVLDELHSFKENGPSKTVMEKVQEIQIRKKETQLQQNQYWINVLANNSLFSHPPVEDIQQFSERVRQISPKDIKRLANFVIKHDHYLLGVLMPLETE